MTHPDPGTTDANRPLWGDLHNHNAVGYGNGSLDRSYAIARGALLDVYAFTPHGRWADMPKDDPSIVAFHAKGYEKVREHWPLIQQKANDENEDGRFTALIGFEWHSSAFGDYHVLLPGDQRELADPEHVEELQAYARECGALMIPHHLGYPQGWRGANWAHVQPDVTPCVDVFSEHGCAMEPETPHPFVLHSMGGIERSQTAMAQLAGGKRFGVLGSTDNHHGHPASYGEGLAGIWAESHTRAGVLDAIRRRQTFVVSGDRIIPRLHLGEAMMGDAIDPATPRELRYHAAGSGPIMCAQIVKNGRVVHTHVPDPEADSAGDDEGYVARLDFGWDAMTGDTTTDWRIRVGVEGGSIRRVDPCFAGGAGSHEKLNRVVSHGPDHCEIEAFTSRRNDRHTSGIALHLAGDASTRLNVSASTTREGAAGGAELTSTLGDLRGQDRWAAISSAFSAPRIYLGRAYPASACTIESGWRDPAPGPDDWYMLKIMQNNGQLAYASPVFCQRP